MSYSSICLLLLVILLLLAKHNQFKALAVCLILYPTLNLFKISGAFPVWGIVNIILFVSIILKKRKQLRGMPFKTPLILWGFSYILSYIFGEYNNLGGIMYFIQFPLFVPLVWVLYKPNTPNNKFLLIVLCIYVVISALYGSYEAFTFTKPFTSWIMSISQAISKSGENQYRLGFMRAFGFTQWFTYFALTSCCAYSIFVSFLQYTKTKKSKFILLLLSFFCIYSIIITMDRSAMVIIFFMIIILNIKIFMKERMVFFVFVAIFFIAYNLFGNLFDDIIFSITHAESKEVAGSSMSMRISQLKGAYEYTESNIIFGKGLVAISDAVKRVPRLLGGESLLFEILINRGLVGIAATFSLYTYVSIYFFRRKNYSIMAIFLLLTFYNFLTLPIHEIYALPFILLLYKNATVNCLPEKNGSNINV